MSEPNYVYFFIRADECSPLLQSAPDGEDAAEAIYERQAQKRLQHLGVEVLACEMPGWRSNDIILNSVTEHLGQASAELAPLPAAPVVIDADYLADLLFYAIRDHLTVDMFRSLVAADTMEWSGPSVEAQAAMNAIARDVCSALRGADLASEGARDDK